MNNQFNRDELQLILQLIEPNEEGHYEELDSLTAKVRGMIEPPREYRYEMQIEQAGQDDVTEIIMARESMEAHAICRQKYPHFLNISCKKL